MMAPMAPPRSMFRLAGEPGLAENGARSRNSHLREIVLDTETTGLDPAGGDRVIEVGCLELVNHIATGRTFQRYVNPEREVPAEAAAIHGLTTEKLAGKPLFAAIAPDFLDFIADSPLVIHNAAFDIGFLNAEFARMGAPPLDPSRAIDTLAIARRKFPGAPASLDALCKRFGVDNSARELHGALLDVELLAEVYVELIGGRQPGLGLASSAAPDASAARAARPHRAPRPHVPSAAEQAAHTAFLAKLKDPIWSR